jgi:hypothetical protein
MQSVPGYRSPPPFKKLSRWGKTAPMAFIKRKDSFRLSNPRTPTSPVRGFFWKINPDEENLHQVNLEPKVWALHQAGPPTGLVPVLHHRLWWWPPIGTCVFYVFLHQKQSKASHYHTFLVSVQRSWALLGNFVHVAGKSAWFLDLARWGSTCVLCFFFNPKQSKASHYHTFWLACKGARLC